MAASESRYLPPSEKLSGVIFKTPITSVRSPRISVRERSRKRNVCGETSGNIIQKGTVANFSRENQQGRNPQAEAFTAKRNPGSGRAS